jgi:hypothetical protein
MRTRCCRCGTSADPTTRAGYRTCSGGLLDGQRIADCRRDAGVPPRKPKLSAFDYLHPASFMMLGGAGGARAIGDRQARARVDLDRPWLESFRHFSLESDG